jgi:HEAT repeat protein
MKIKKKLLITLFITFLMMLLDAGCDSTENRMKVWREEHNVAKLEKMLVHKRIDIRLYAISLMAQTCHPDAVKPLIGCLQNDDTRIRSRATEALGYLGSSRAVDKSAVAQLANMLKSPGNASRCDIMAILGCSGRPEAIPPLVEMLYDQDDSIRESAIEALKHLARESKYPYCQIESKDVVAISNALDAAQSDRGVSSKVEK